MALTISTNIRCNTIDCISNKGQKPPVLVIDANKVAVRYDDIGIVVLRPSIDRLKFGFFPDQKLLNKYDPSCGLDEFKEHIKKSLAGDGFQPKVTSLSYVDGVSFKKPPYSLYNVNLIFKPSNDSEPIIIQIDPKKGGYPFMRFDMNPNRITKQDMKKFWELIEGVMVVPGANISQEDFLIWSKIYSAEIAVDILGARPSDMEIKPLVANKPVTKKSHVYKSGTGRAETVYPKVKKGKSSTEYVYDKRKEQTETGKEPVYKDFLHSRYECRVQNTTFYKLSNIKNRCVRISVRVIDFRKFNKLSLIHHLFIRHALVRTLDKALELIPDKSQPKFKKSYCDTMQDIWDAKKIWSYWQGTIKDSGFFP